MNTLRNHRLSRLFVLLLMSTIWAFFNTKNGYALSNGDETHIVYGGSSWLGHYPAWVGLKKGIFKQKGLNLTFRRFYTSSSRMGALVAGNVHFASTGAISAIALMASGVKLFYAVGTQDSYANVEGIIARTDIRSVMDLKGKKLAVTFASSAHVLVLDILEQHGFDTRKDITLINLKVSEMPAAFISGEVDACAAWTPMFNKILSIENAHLLLDDTAFSLYKSYGLGPGPDVLVVRKDFPEKAPEASKAFLRGYFESVELLKNRPRECAAALLELTNLDMDQQLDVLKEVTWYGLDKQYELMDRPGSFVSGLQKLADFLEKHRQIDRSPRIADWVNTRLLP